MARDKYHNTCRRDKEHATGYDERMPRRVPSAPAWPRWIDPKSEINLREVRSGLFVGGQHAAAVRRAVPWRAVVDFYGSSAGALRAGWYQGAALLRWPFDDGDDFPEGALDTVYGFVLGHLGRGPVLFHCQAGLSRSASAAYAMMRRIDGLGHEAALARVRTADPRFPMSRTLDDARAWVHEG